MMQIEGLNSIIHRIDELNMRFGINTAANYQENVNKTAATGGVEQEKPQRLENGSFATELDKAMSMESRGAVGLNISGDTNSLIKEAAARYQVDPRLVAAVAQTESGGNQEAVSPAGAVGVMQLMPETAAGLGVNPYDKRQNIEGGAKYLRQMMDTFGGDVQKAVAAYNAGPVAVKRYKQNIE